MSPRLTHGPREAILQMSSEQVGPELPTSLPKPFALRTFEMLVLPSGAHTRGETKELVVEVKGERAGWLCFFWETTVAPIP